MGQFARIVAARLLHSCWIAPAALLTLALGLSACGSSSSSSTASGSAGAGSSTNAAATSVSPSIEADVQRLYKGDFQPPPASGPKAVRGKNVWYISCGQLFAACQAQTAGFVQAGRVLGWHVTAQDGKADPTTAAGLIRQAVAAHVSAIGISGYDCPTIETALQAAKSASIPVVSISAADCNDPTYGGKGPSLFTSVNFRGSDLYSAFKDAWTAARVPYIVAKAGLTPKVITITEDSYAAERSAYQVLVQTFKNLCPKCTLYKVPFTYAQVPNPATQEWTTGIQSHPDANVVEYGVDALMSLGLQTAIQDSGRRGLIVGGGEGYPLNFNLIRQGIQTFSVAIPYDWVGWGLADTMNRIFADKSATSLPSEGAGWQYVDKTHNLPAPGAQYEPPVNFRAAYQKIWNG